MLRIALVNITNLYFKGADKYCTKLVLLLFVYVSICLLSIFKAFLPNSKANPSVKAKKNINIITNPYIPFVYALTT